jgi:hypothetical protein
MTGYYNSIGFITITGTSSVLGTFNYSIPLTGGTGIAVNATGSITVNRTPAAVTSLSSNAPLCEGGQLNLLAQGAFFSNSYSMQDNSGVAFIDIAATGTNVPGSLGDDSKHTIEIPTFNYYGQNYNSATVSSNGIIIFGNVASGDYFSNQMLPAANYASGYTYMAPYWDDLLPGQTSSIKTQTVGNNFIIQYTILGFYNGDSQPITFQVQLNLVTEAIVFVYSNVVTGNAATTNGKSATVGIQKNTTTAVQYSYNTASLSNGMSISFTPVYLDAFAWTGPNGFSSNLLTPTIPNATTAASGNYQFQMISSQGCASAASTLPVTITPVSLLLSSGAETTAQTVNYGASISPIVYTTNGTIAVTGLPPGLSAVTTNNSLIIAGTPTGSGSYQYTVTGSAGCGNDAIGTITIVPVFLTSDQATTNQTVCASTAITPIVYNGNVTQAVVSGLPGGVTASIYGNTMTFSGTPATAGNYTYAIAVNGITTGGMIGVNPLPASPTITSSGATTICEGSSVTLSASAAASVEPIDNLSGAVLATGLHKIVSSYTGPALRLRRDGDNAEQDFGFVGNDLDVNAINEWLNGTNGYCTTLYDQTGHNGSITQNDMFRQPQFLASGLNNRPILHFTTEHFMFNEVVYPSNFSVVYGAKITGVSARVLSARYNNWLLGYWMDFMDNAYFEGWVNNNFGISHDNAFNIYAGTGNGTVSTIYKNGTQLFSGSEGVAAPNGLQINQYMTATERSDVDFTDIIIYDTELSSQNVGKVYNFIAGYYGGVLGQSINNFAWSTNENTTQIEVSTAGEYSVRTIGGNGCLSAPSTVTSVSVIAAPTVIVPANQTYCDGTVTSEIALTGTPSDVTFTIQNGAAIGLNDVTGVTAIPSFTAIGGTATVSITPVSNGCSGLPVFFTITVNKTLFNLEASATMVCPDSPVTISTDVAAPLTYCNAINSGAGTTYCKITYVGFGSIDNDTSNDISSDTTIHPVGGTTTTVVQPGEAYLLNVSSTNAGADVGVWIDYNRNGVFESTEFTEVYQDNETGTVNITIPNDATIGQTRMRVRSEYYVLDRVNSNASCDTFSYGTTQDYTITIGQDVQVGTSGTVSWSSDPFDASVSNATTASVTTNPSVTTTYAATVTSATTGCTATKAVTVTVQTGVIITLQPKEFIANCEGQIMEMGLGATGVGLTYQWYKDGQPLIDGNNITGATAPLLMFNPGPTLNDVGSYTVIIHPLCGDDAVSSASVLTVIPSPTVQPIANQTYCSGAVTSEMALIGTPSNVQYMISGGAAIGLNDGYGFTTIPAFTAVAGTATITVTPYANGCAGVPVTYTITVNQTPTVALSSDAPSAVCPGTAVTISADLTIGNNTSIPGPYCKSGHWNTNISYITNVTFGSINNNTENDRDTWGTIHPVTASTTTVVIPGETYLLTVATGSPYEANVVAWIDYNRNGFFDASEYTPVIQNAFDGTVSITIPMDASHGTTGMRICSNYIDRDFESTNGCTWYFNGTTHDYTITIGQDLDNTISWSSDPVDEALSTVNTASITTNPAVTTTYTATVTSLAGCSATATTTFTVQYGVVVNSQPVAQSICQGQFSNFTIGATGVGLTYQWYKDGQPLTDDGGTIFGSTTAYLYILGLSANDNGVYTVTVHPQCGDEVVSEGATLLVNPTPTVEPIPNQTYCSGAVAAMLLTGAPSTVTYAISGGNAIGLYDVSDVATIPAFTAVAGTATITVTPYANGCAGNPTIFDITVNRTSTVSVTSDASLVCPGTPVTILADIDTDPMLPYCNSVNYYPFICAITNINFGAINSDTTSSIAHQETTVVQPGETYTLSVNANYLYSDQPYIGAWIDFNNNGIYESSEYSELVLNATTGSVSITIPTDAAIGKTGMRIRSDYWGTHQDFQYNAGRACDDFYYGSTEDYTITIGQVVSDNTISWSSDPIDESLSNVNTASITTNPAVTTTYTATVTSLAGCSATATTTVNVQSGVVINTQPVAETTVCEGEYVVAFSVEATGVGLTYQWFKDGQLLTDGGSIFRSTTTSLLIFGLSPNDNGVYTVMVHPQCGDDVVSAGATLTVNPIPVVEPIANQTYCSDTLTSAIPLLGSPNNVSYIISGGEAIGLAEALGVDSIPAFTAVAGTATITVTPIANGCVGQPTTFTITVNARPTVALTSSATTATCSGSSVSISADIAYTDPMFSYCKSGSQFTDVFPITNINFGAINSDTSNDLLSIPNTHQETTLVQPGETYELNVNTAPYSDFGVQYFPYVGAWIDYNRNGIYESYEYSEVYSHENNGAVSITIPTNAAIGKTGMRIRSNWERNSHGFQYDSGSSCEYYRFGTTQDYTITIGQDVPAYTVAWTSNPVDASISNATTASITPSPVVTTTYTATVTPATGCATSTSVVVEVLPAIAIAQHPSNTNICSAVGSTAVLSVATNVFAPSIAWQYRVVTTASPNPAWITITSANAGAVYSSFTTGNLMVTKTATLPAAGTQYRVKVTDACNSSATTNVAMLSIITTVKAGTITAPASVCLGGDATLTVGGYTGTSLQWQSAPISTTAAPGVFTDILGATSASYTIYGATADVNKSYRVIVYNSCNNTTATTAVKTITVNPLSVPGTITGGGIVCAGSGSTVKVAGNVGTIQWQYAIDGENYFNAPTAATASTTIPFGTTSTSSTTATYLVTAIATDVYFRAKITSGACSSTYTTPVLYTISAKAVVGSIAPENRSLCSGTGTTLTLSEAVGTITWQKATNLTTPVWTAIANSNTLSIDTGNLTVATAYRAMVTIGSCSTVYSNIAYVYIVAKPLAKTITLNTTAPTGATAAAALCTSSTAKVLTLGAGSIGDIQWEKSTLSSTAGFTDIVGATGTSYTIANPSVGANYYRVRFSNSCYDVAYSKVVTVYYKDCAPRAKVDVTVPFAIIAYPNPYTETFNLSLTTSSEAAVGVSIYDMTGKLIDKREVAPNEVPNLQIGDRYATGVYNVIVTQGSEVKTLRVIKR